MKKRQGNTKTPRKSFVQRRSRGEIGSSGKYAGHANEFRKKNKKDEGIIGGVGRDTAKTSSAYTLNLTTSGEVRQSRYTPDFTPGGKIGITKR